MQAAYEETSHIVLNLRHTILNVQTESAKRVQSLSQIISKQKEALDRYEIELLAFNSIIVSLKTSYEKQETKLKEITQKWTADRRKLQKLEVENESLKGQVATLTKNLELEKRKKDAMASSLIELRPNTSTSASITLVMSRKGGGTKRSSASIPLVRPEVDACVASAKSLERRAKQLKQVSVNRCFILTL